MSRILIAVTCAVSLSSVAAIAQTDVTPEQHLEQARQLLAAVPAAPAAAGQALTALQRDFAEFASAYLARVSSTAPSAASDWRARYLLVEADLTTLIGPPSAQGPAAVMPGLDPTAAQQLQRARQHLETLYAATINTRDGNPVAHTGPDTTGAPVPPTGAAPQTPPRDQGQQMAAAAGQTASGRPPTPGMAQSGTQQPGAQPATATAPAAQASATVSIDPGVAAALIDRMQTLVDNAIAGKPSTPGPVGTTGSVHGAGKITIDRATLDELRSEIAQLRLMLQR